MTGNIVCYQFNISGGHVLFLDFLEIEWYYILRKGATCYWRIKEKK